MIHDLTNEPLNEAEYCEKYLTRINKVEVCLHIFIFKVNK